MIRMRSALLSALFVALLSPPVLAQGPGIEFTAGDDLVDRIAAVVGDSVILASQVEERILQLRAQGVAVPDDPVALQGVRRSVLESLVDEQILIQAALQDTTVVIDEDRIEEVISQDLEERTRAFGGHAGLQEALSAQGLSVSAYREILRNEARRQQLQSQFIARQRQSVRGVTVSEEEMREFFEEQRAQIGARPATVTFQQIVFQPVPTEEATEEARAEAERLLGMLRSGEGDFETLARRFSDDPGTRQAGGDLGWFRRGTMVPAFEDAVFSLREGQTSNVVESPFGFHIIRVDRIRGAERRARHILVRPELTSQDVIRARALGEELRSRLQAGESIDELQEIYGDEEHPDSLSVPTNQLGELPPGYESVLRGAQAGEVIGPVEWGPQDRLNLAVIKVEEVREEGEFSLEEVRPQIRQRLQQEKLLDRILEDLRERTHVEVRM